jgi:hypothetical protein
VLDVENVTEMVAAVVWLTCGVPSIERLFVHPLPPTPNGIINPPNELAESAIEKIAAIKNVRSLRIAMHPVFERERERNATETAFRSVLRSKAMR